MEKHRCCVGTDGNRWYESWIFIMFSSTIWYEVVVEDGRKRMQRIPFWLWLILSLPGTSTVWSYTSGGENRGCEKMRNEPNFFFQFRITRDPCHIGSTCNTTPSLSLIVPLDHLFEHKFNFDTFLTLHLQSFSLQETDRHAARTQWCHFFSSRK